MDKFLEEMLEAMLGETHTKKEESAEKKPLADAELDEAEFKSLVSEEEMEAVKQVKSAVDNLCKVHMSSALNLATKKDMDAKRALHYIVFMEIIRDTVNDAHMLTEVNTKAVKAMEEVHRETGKTYRQLLIAKTLGDMLS